jgi:hypothetical protein
MVRSKKVNKWAQSIQQARKELNVKGFVAINRGTVGKQIYQRAKQIHQGGNRMTGGSSCGGHAHNPLLPTGGSRSMKGGSRTNLIGGSRKKNRSNKMTWFQAVSKARNQLGIQGFVAINKGQQGKQLYKLAKQIYN